MTDSLFVRIEFLGRQESRNQLLDGLLKNHQKTTTTQHQSNVDQFYFFGRKLTWYKRSFWDFSSISFLKLSLFLVVDFSKEESNRLEEETISLTSGEIKLNGTGTLSLLSIKAKYNFVLSNFHTVSASLFKIQSEIKTKNKI